jgi:PAS domain S-box-containing protein
VTVDTNSVMTRDVAVAPTPDDALLLTRVRLGLWVVLVAIVAFTLADERLAPDALHATTQVRLVQLALIGVAALLLRLRMGRRLRVATVVAFLSGLYLTSAVAGSLRGEATTQPITDLAIAFATATTLPWGAWPQFASVLVALVAIGLDVRLVQGTLAGVSPHMAAGVTVAFLVSVYIAHQLERHRRARDAAETALRHSEQRFRALIERGRDVITIVGADGVIQYDSPSLTRLSGHGPNERLGADAASFVHPDDLDLVRGAVAEAASGSARTIECRVARRDGSWSDVEAVITDLRDDPAVAGIVVNWRDIGERRRADAERARYVEELARARDEALASTRAKSLFLANMSHEIRTPMNVIIGLTEMLLDSPLTNAQRADLDRVRDGAVGLLAILNDVLDTSKIEAGKLSLEIVDMDARRTIEEAVGLLAPAAAAKGLSLTCAVSPELPARVKGDPVRLRQALVNLVSNAVKFTEAGSVTVEATMVRRTADGVVARLTVRDTGIGIPEARQAAIFESFTQADESTNRVYGGTGLGLSICRSLVALMGGRMGLESVPGRGSTFWIELGLGRAAAAGAVAA